MDLNALLLKILSLSSTIDVMSGKSLGEKEQAQLNLFAHQLAKSIDELDAHLARGHALPDRWRSAEQCGATHTETTPFTRVLRCSLRRGHQGIHKFNMVP